MALLSVCCNHCGAPLQVGESVRFVTCQFCNSQLQVTQTESAAYTEVIKQIADQNMQMMSNLRVIELQNELERLDREWAGKYGGQQVPAYESQSGVPILGIIIGLVVMAIFVSFSIFWFIMTRKGGTPFFFSLFGPMIAFVAVLMGIKTFTSAFQQNEDKYAFKVRRDGILRQINEARQER